MPQELHNILIKLAWFPFTLGTAFAIGLAIAGVLIHKSSEQPTYLMGNDVFKYSCVICACLFIVAFAFWIVAWIY